MAVFKRGNIWWYKFRFAGRTIRESAKTTRKTVATEAEKKRRLELEKGYNGIEDKRSDNVRSVRQIADEYLEEYKLRHKSATFAEYALRRIKKHLGDMMAVDVSKKTVTGYQTARLKDEASSKTINEEVGFLLRLLEDRGEAIRGQLRREKKLKLAVNASVARPFSQAEKTAMLKAARKATSSAIYPSLVIALNTGMRDSEIKRIQWFQVDFEKRVLTVGESKSEGGTGRTIPLNKPLFKALVDYAKWYTERFGVMEPEWYVFPFGKPRPHDPTRPVTTLKTAWKNVKKAAGVEGRWHDNRHTLVTELSESGAGDETIMEIAGHVSKRMLKHYSHIRMEAKRKALDAIGDKNGEDAETGHKGGQREKASSGVGTEVGTVGKVN